MCRFSFISAPRTDFDNVYNFSYYEGKGADPYVNYIEELENPSSSIRNYEWMGIVNIYKSLAIHNGKWLDFGCGIGGLVKFAKSKDINIVGFEDSPVALWAKQEYNIPILNSHDLPSLYHQFDFISAIEVLEHSIDPIHTLQMIRSLLKPNGILFLTTGNAKPWRHCLLDWKYTEIPDIHISFFEPGTLEIAFEKSNLKPAYLPFNKTYVNIIKFKILKNLKIKHNNSLFNLLPWQAITKMADLQHQVSKQPYGIAI